ncbi:class I SAM-dependent methyltransferase [Allosphingosinicella sp.]|uniref:class I SAM-dependent methyltransferase n=1 Tax=Allosphingosinicella sp. TaxID=2823234 RepID=UPI002F12C8CA
MPNQSSELLESARALDEAGRPAEALEAAWNALRLAPDDEAKRVVVQLLAFNPRLARPEWREDIASLIDDSAVEPTSVARAGWHILLPSLPGVPEALAERIESDELALRLLDQTYVAVLEAEETLTRLRRWLLMTGRWAEFPNLVAALAAQAGHNGGAWLFDSEEKAAIEAGPDAPIARAYRPRPSVPPPGADYPDPVTRSVADQYLDWPYPAWSRVTAPAPTTLPAEVDAMDEGRPSGLPATAQILVAGCGTGREAALIALRFPDSRVTAIDLSPASLSYAAERCAAGGLRNIDFRLLDLNRVTELGRTFHFITCSGVLHHLPDPEAGWAALAGVLEPGGVIRIMLYSKLARLRIRAAQAQIADLRDRPVDDEVLREARRRLIETAAESMGSSLDFFTLGGVHDLLLHRHEDPFDVPRIVRALDALGLELLAFELPTPFHRARYLREHPHDPLFRDVRAWAALEKQEPFLFRSMYRFWCRKPAG